MMNAFDLYGAPGTFKAADIFAARGCYCAVALDFGSLVINYVPVVSPVPHEAYNEHVSVFGTVRPHRKPEWKL